MVDSECKQLHSRGEGANSISQRMISLQMWYDSDDEKEDAQYLRLHNSKTGGSKCLGGGAPPSCAPRGQVSPPSSMYRKALSDISEGLCKDLTKSANSYGTMPRLQSNGCSGNCNAAPFVEDLTNKILKLSPDQIATQITLGDFSVFKAISPDELTTCGWTKKDKHKTSPNIVMLTKRFNHLSFWVVHETLNAGGVKSRAEIMAHFIKVARRLGYLSNYHSQFAVISSLQSAPIYRLRKTWAALSKKDRNHFDRMAEIFSEKNNWEKLRSHVDALKLPMIPYLGLFLTDIVYIDMAHPHFGGLESEPRQLKMNNLLRVLADYQQSDYTRLPRLPRVQQYLSSIKYIEELQKFVEEDHYKLSVCLEPNTPLGSHNTSKDSLADCGTGGSTPSGNCKGPTSPVRCSTLGGRGHHGAPCGSNSVTSSGSKFLPGHRKARSLGTKFRSMSLPRNLHRSENSSRHSSNHGSSIVDKFGIFKGCSVATTSSSEGSRCDSLTSLGGGALHQHAPTCPSSQYGSKHLLDDSDIDPPPHSASSLNSTHNIIHTLPPVPPPPSMKNNGNGAPSLTPSRAGSIDYSAMSPATNIGVSIATLSQTGKINSRTPLTRTWSGLSSADECDGTISTSAIAAMNRHMNQMELRGAEGVTGSVGDCSMQGPLRRKTVLKDGRKPPVGAWHRYWVQLWGGALVYYHPKSLASRGLERGDFKTSPCKLQPLAPEGGKLLLFGPHHESRSQLDMFQLSDQTTDTIYKFRAPSIGDARCWLTKIANALQEDVKIAPENLMSFE